MHIAFSGENKQKCFIMIDDHFRVTMPGCVFLAPPHYIFSCACTDTISYRQDEPSSRHISTSMRDFFLPLCGSASRFSLVVGIWSFIVRSSGLSHGRATYSLFAHIAGIDGKGVSVRRRLESQFQASRLSGIPRTESAAYAALRCRRFHYYNEIDI